MTEFFLSLTLVWIALYIGFPIWLAIKGRLLSAGLVQLVGALLPGIWHGIFWPKEAGNFVLLMMALLPIPILLCVFGIIAILARAYRRQFEKRPEAN